MRINKVSISTKHVKARGAQIVIHRTQMWLRRDQADIPTLTLIETTDLRARYATA